MKLIGAGLPRTATLSQKIALETLGLGPCYHMVNILSDLDLVRRWIDAFDGKHDWDELFAGFQSTVDWPGSFFYQELIDAYPDAKVLLSVRDGASWVESMTNTIWAVFYGDGLMRHVSAARGHVDAGWRNYIELMEAMWQQSGLLASTGTGGDPVPLAAEMERYNAEVQANVPSDRLLVWSAVEGWEPLCQFLELPIPDVPFPRVNDSETFVDRIVDASIKTLNDWQGQQALSTSK